MARAIASRCSGGAQLLLFLRIGEEADLDEDGGHGRAAQHVEARLLDAAIDEAERLGHRVQHRLGEEARLLLELGLGHVPEDALEQVRLLTRLGALELDHAVLDGGDLSGLVVAWPRRTRNAGLHPFRDGPRMRVGVDGHEEVGALLVGEIGALAQRHERRPVLRVSTTLMPSPSSIIRAARRGHVEHHIAAFHLDAGAGPGGARTMPAVAGSAEQR